MSVNTEKQRNNKCTPVTRYNLINISRQAKLKVMTTKYRLNYENLEMVLGLEILHGDCDYKVNSLSGSSPCYF